MSLLAPAVLLCSVVAGYVAGQRIHSDAPLPAQPTAPFPGEFDGAAFQKNATTDDLLDVAERVVAEVAGAYPKSPLALSVAGRKAHLLRDTEQAAEIWRRSLDLDPMFADGFFGLGLVMMDRDDYQAAAQCFEEVVWRVPDEPRAPVLLAESLLNRGEVDQAILVLEEVASASSASAEALTMLGQAYLQAQQYEQARRRFELVVQSFPNMKKALYGLARVYARQGESKRAEVYMRRFRELDQQGRDARAEEAKTFVDKEYATHVAAQAHHDAARAYRAHGDLSKAEEFWRKAVFLEPESTHYLNRLLKLYESQQRHVDCLRVTERLVELNPSNVDHWLNLGVLRAHLGRSDAALSAFQKAVELDPDNARCRQVLEQLQVLESPDA